MSYTVKILFIEFVTHDVKRFIIEKPKGFTFEPGAAVRMSINKPDWIDQKRPFTMTSSNDDMVLEFLIKTYKEHKGVTAQMDTLVPGDELVFEDPFDTMMYKGKGTFFAGGVGITPVLSIFRMLRKENALDGHSLYYANKSSEDIVAERELRHMFLGREKNLVFQLTREEKEGFGSGRIDGEFIKKHVTDFSTFFHICGPPPFIKDLKEVLVKFGADPSKIEI